jgi:hypothetical protein
MSAPALVGAGGPTLRIRGTAYPVLLPTVRDPRLHLATVIVSLQVLGQVAFEFRLSIAQILVSLLTCAVLEFGIVLWRRRVIMWPASALLTGNGVAFVLRVPGTQHGDWWSMRGAWIFAGTAAVSLLSKYVIRFRGRHVFNPSNFGLVLCFLTLGAARAEPLDFWWGPMSFWLGLAVAIIVVGGLVILSRIGLLAIAVGFWLAFAAGMAILAASGHAMTARWHLGPITGTYFWWVLVTSPELLVFLFFMITDPKTAPAGRTAQRVYAVGVALLATLLIAPQRTEYATKVALLGALAIACAAVPATELIRGVLAGRRIDIRAPRRRTVGALALLGAAAFAGLVVVAGIPSRSTAQAASAPVLDTSHLPQVTIVHSKRVASQIDRPTSLRIARDVAADLSVQADALRLRNPKRAAAGAGGAGLAALQRRIREGAGRPVVVPTYRVEQMRVTLEPGKEQGPPVVVATLSGVRQLTTYEGSPPMVQRRSEAVPFKDTFELTLDKGRFLIIGTGGTATVTQPSGPAQPTAVAATFGRVRLTDVAPQVGLDFHQDGFRFGADVSDVHSMMGGGLCWLDYDNDGWLDLFVVNSYSDSNIPQWQAHGGMPRSALFHNVHGKFVEVSARSQADVAVQGNGCVPIDLGNGHQSLFITTNTYNVLLWNNGDGSFTNITHDAGIDAFRTYGWHTGAAVADVNGDGRQDIFVSGYADVNAPADSARGFPRNYKAFRDLLYLNEGPGAHGHPRFKDVSLDSGIETKYVDHSLGAVFTDVNGDGRPDLYIANDTDPNRLYVNVAWPGGAARDPLHLGFRLEDQSQSARVADRNAGMGVAAQDVNGDGRTDLFVTNSRGESHAAFLSAPIGGGKVAFGDWRSAFTPAFGTNGTGWGATWADLDNDGNEDLVVANGGIPISTLAKSAGQIQVLENMTGHGQPGSFANAGAAVGIGAVPPVNGRGVAAADFDNDGRIDIAVSSIGGPLILLRNSGPPGHWLEVSLRGFHPGALVTAVLPDGRRLVREVQAGSSYLSSEDRRVHFGLGPASTVRELDVRYPDGHVTRRENVSANQILTVSP